MIRLLTMLLFCSLRLWCCTQVEGDRILGKDLAAALAVFAGIDPMADLGPAPVAGSGRTLPRRELERIAGDRGIVLVPNTTLSVCFERVAVKLNEAELRPVLEAALPGSEILIADFSRTPLPVGAPQFRAADLGVDGLWRGRWVYGARSVPIWVRVSVRDRASGREIGRTRSSEPEVARGETIRVEVRSGGVLLAFDAAAENAGHTGESVTVRNPVNGQRVRAIVEGPGKAGIRK